MSDRELLRQYVADRSETAFARLMEQHIKLVYWTSRRDVKDPDLAEDVTQVVFMLLARKAATLGKDVSLSGWLFNTTRLASRNALRHEQRRLHLEQKAAMMMDQTVHHDAEWSEIEPWLNDGLTTLPDPDREAVLLRYYGGLNYRELAGELGVTEDAARMRISRAIGKLRRFLTKKEVPISAIALIALMADHPADAVPPSCHAGALVAARNVIAGPGSGAAGHSQTGQMLREVERLSRISIHKKAALTAMAAATGVAVFVSVAVFHQPRASHLRTPQAAVNARSVSDDRKIAASVPAPPTVVARPDMIRERQAYFKPPVKPADTALGPKLVLINYRQASWIDQQIPDKRTLRNEPGRVHWWVDDVMTSYGAYALLEIYGKKQVVRPGDVVRGGKIIAIDSNRVVIDTNNGRRIEIPCRDTRTDNTGTGTQKITDREPIENLR